jgi:putative transposase
MANINKTITEPLLFHCFDCASKAPGSDRVIQYARKDFINYLKTNTLAKKSMRTKGNCLDNALAESFFKTIKTQLIYHHKYKKEWKQNYKFLNTSKLHIIEQEGIQL